MGVIKDYNNTKKDAVTTSDNIGRKKVYIKCCCSV